MKAADTAVSPAAAAAAVGLPEIGGKRGQLSSSSSVSPSAAAACRKGCFVSTRLSGVVYSHWCCCSSSGPSDELAGAASPPSASSASSEIKDDASDRRPPPSPWRAAAPSAKGKNASFPLGAPFRLPAAAAGEQAASGAGSAAGDCMQGMRGGPQPRAQEFPARPRTPETSHACSAEFF
ncbi:uncharacterized protein LOC113147261 [Cyclospora cayetanensis]|uniref:Uncharacterized protein LOC113147261 n=1 Tax=Cyclospora cayetanensis TaxID=88456 RepID=A0A6P6S045_9EIME|nr:uncharacterized protein LOC113147261 [Cyclospora cayetanensis]